MQYPALSVVLFFASLVVTFCLAAYGRRKTTLSQADDALDGRQLNRWLVGLSAGATANSGFIVTGAVGLGYLYGLQWVMLPLAWMLGDLLFWSFFPERMNKIGREHSLITVSQTLKSGLPERWGRLISIISALILLVGLGSYTSAQWLAGQKFLNGAFGFSNEASLLLFAAVIISYSAIGGFRGSVLVDTFQAVLRLISTVILLGLCGYSVMQEPQFAERIANAGDQFLQAFPQTSFVAVIGFVLGWAASAFGFSLSQPQIISRYYAASSPLEAKKAQWIYIGYVQFTWISMTVLGMAFRGLMPDLADPEASLSIFIQQYSIAIVGGIILADVFGVIASTANSLVLALAQSLKYDVIEQYYSKRIALWPLVLVIGVASMLFANIFDGSVATLATKSAKYMGAGLAGPMMIKILKWRHSGLSLVSALLSGIMFSLMWAQFGYLELVNETLAGILAALGVNWVVARMTFESLNHFREKSCS